MKYLILLLLLPCFTKAQIIKDTAYASGICSFGRQSLYDQKVADSLKHKAYNKDSSISLELVNMGNSTIEYIYTTPIVYVIDGKLFTDKKQVDSLLRNKIIIKRTRIKDADATAIYGSRAANGTVIIKTKNQ